MSIEYLKNDLERVKYLLNLLKAKAVGGKADSREFQILRQQLLSKPKIESALPQWLGQHGSLDSFWVFIKQKFRTYDERTDFLSKEFTHVQYELECGVQKAPVNQQVKKITPSPPVVATNKRKVFIVHGRDNEAKQEVSRFIEKLGLEAIILHEQASSGMTIIEKIENYSNDADFALVLYTACDQGCGAHESKNVPKNRARQNVVFEHGYFMAKLGRNNVCALVKGAIETPNDISGIVYVDLDPLGAWKNEIAKELKACGYSINSVL